MSEQVPEVFAMPPLPFENPFAEGAREIAEWMDRDVLKGSQVSVRDFIIGDKLRIGDTTYEVTDVEPIPLDGTWDGIHRMTITPTDRKEQR